MTVAFRYAVGMQLLISAWYFLYESYRTFKLEVVLFHADLMLSLLDDLRELGKTVWHWINFTDGS